MAAPRRVEKIQSLIQREISSYLIKEIQNPHIGFVTILRVEMNRDLTVAKVFVSFFGDEKLKNQSYKALRSTEKYVQFLLGRNLTMKNTPLVHFVLSDALEAGDNMSEKLSQLESNPLSKDEM